MARCKVTFRLYTKDASGMFSGPAKDVAPSTEEILERTAISVIEFLD